MSNSLSGRKYTEKYGRRLLNLVKPGPGQDSVSEGSVSGSPAPEVQVPETNVCERPALTCVQLLMIAACYTKHLESISQCRSDIKS